MGGILVPYPGSVRQIASLHIHPLGGAVTRVQANSQCHNAAHCCRHVLRSIHQMAADALVLIFDEHIQIANLGEAAAGERTSFCMRQNCYITRKFSMRKGCEYLAAALLLLLIISGVLGGRFVPALLSKCLFNDGDVILHKAADEQCIILIVDHEASLSVS